MGKSPCFLATDETLMEHGVPFQVVPGITAANGVSAYAGIPLTHRDYAQSCIFTTGHLKPQVGQNDTMVELDWPALTRPNQTVVIYMGLVGLDQICAKLIAHGLSANTPAAVVQQGTTMRQRVVVGNLSDLAARVSAAELKPPCLIVVGEVVKFEPVGESMLLRIRAPQQVMLEVKVAEINRTLAENLGIQVNGSGFAVNLLNGAANLGQASEERPH